MRCSAVCSMAVRRVANCQACWADRLLHYLFHASFVCRHIRCRVPDQKRVVRCPLCRELAVVPHSLLPAELILELAKPPSSRRSSQRRSSSTVATVAVPASPL